MNTKKGHYTLLSGIELQILLARIETQEMGSLFFLQNKECANKTINGIHFDAQGLSKVSLPLGILSNAYEVNTYSSYKGYEFEIYPYRKSDTIVHFVTNDAAVSKHFSMVTLHDELRQPYFLGEAELSELDCMWELRKQSSLPLPYPKDLPTKHIIYKKENS